MDKNFRIYAIMPEYLATMPGLVGPVGEDKLQTATPRTAYSGGSAIAVLPVYGSITQRGGWYGELSLTELTSRFRQAMADPDIAAVVLDVESPGGEVSGVPEFAAEVYAARTQKPVIAVANSLAASAAYWIASAASEMVVTPSGEVGSIGVFAAHYDYSRAMDEAGVTVSLISAGAYKTELNPYQPLNEEARAYVQEQVNEFYQLFTEAVARHRGVTPTAVASGFGQGRVVSSRQALAEGMVDRVATLDEVLAGLKGQPVQMNAYRIAGTDPDTERRARRLRYNEIAASVDA